MIEVGFCKISNITEFLNRKNVTFCCFWPAGEGKNCQLFGIFFSPYKTTQNRWSPRKINKFENRTPLAAMFVDLQISRFHSQKLLILHQSHYFRKLLKTFNMADCYPKNVPSDPHSHLDKVMCSSSPIEIDSMLKRFYREAVGTCFTSWWPHGLK
jgi:hypothetical protein